MKCIIVSLLLLSQTAANEEPSLFGHKDPKLSSQVKRCNGNGVVNSWCDTSIDPSLECVINPESDQYGCRCEHDIAACPTECIDGNAAAATKASVNHNTRTIECRGIPRDEPNYIMRQGKLPLHHCENNAIVSAWCNEWTLPGVRCLLLPSLDEYICSCHDDPAACPEDCVGGTVPDKKTHHGVRCVGIPQDSPNYVLGKGKGTPSLET